MPALLLLSKARKTKKRAYERCIREVQHASFTPLVFSAPGGMAKEATSSYKRLASLLAAKRDQTYSCTITWLRCLLSFSLLRSAIQCIRGARSSKGQPFAIRSPAMSSCGRLSCQISLTYTKSVSFPHPLSSCVFRCSYLHYIYIVYFCTLHLIIYFCPLFINGACETSYTSDGRTAIPMPAYSPKPAPPALRQR